MSSANEILCDCQPIMDRVVIRKIIPQDYEHVVGPDGKPTGQVVVKSSGLSVPLASIENRPECEVLEVGSECKHVKKGDKVLVGHGIAFYHKDYAIIYEGEILAKLR